MNNKDSHVDLFENVPVPRAVLTLAVPTVIGTLVTILYNMADTFFVGFINDPIQTATVTISGNITLLFIAVQNIFGIGGSSFFGRCKGGKSFAEAKSSASFCFWGSVLAGILFSMIYFCFRKSLLPLIGAGSDNIQLIEGYLFYACVLGATPSILSIVIASFVRTEGYSMQASIGTILGCILNIILDPFFILPQFLNMQAVGAGIATLIGNTVSCIYLVSFILRKREKLLISISLKDAIPKRRIVNKVFSVGIPSAIQNVLNVIGIGVLNRNAASFGMIAVASIGIVYKLYFMPMNISTAIGQGAMPLMSYSFGKKDRERFIQTIKFTAVLSLTVVLIGAATEIIFAKPLVRSFMDVDSVVSLGAVLLTELAMGLPFFSFDFLGVSVYQSVGRGKLSLFFAIARKLLLEIPLIFLSVKLLGVYGLGLASGVAELIIAIITFFVLRKICKKPFD